MKKVVVAVAALLCLAGQSFAGVDKLCESRRSEYFSDLSQPPAKTYFAGHVEQIIYPTRYNGTSTVGVYQPPDADFPFKGPARLRRLCFNHENVKVYQETDKARRPITFTSDGQTYVGYRFTLPFEVDLLLGGYCVDEFWLKKPPTLLHGIQWYQNDYAGVGRSCDDLSW